MVSVILIVHEISYLISQLNETHSTPTTTMVSVILIVHEISHLIIHLNKSHSTPMVPYRELPNTPLLTSGKPWSPPTSGMICWELWSPKAFLPPPLRQRNFLLRMECLGTGLKPPGTDSRFRSATRSPPYWVRQPHGF